MYASNVPPDSKSAMRKHPPLISKLNTALHVSVALTALSIAIALFDSSLFSFHPALMSIGYVIFMAEGVISGIMFRHMEPGLERVNAIQSHALLQLRAVVCIAIGFGVIYRNKVGARRTPTPSSCMVSHVGAMPREERFASAEGGGVTPAHARMLLLAQQASSGSQALSRRLPYAVSHVRL